MSLVQNKKAHFNYEITDKYEAGIELLGFEVKSVKNKQGSLDGSYVIIRGGEAYMIGSHIPPFQPANTPKDYDTYRIRRLLLTKKEIAELSNIEREKSLTIIPISMYNKGVKIKVEIGIGKGKKKADKRETLKKRDTEREVRREFKVR